MKLPLDHPQRLELNDEVHARPPEEIRPPTRVSYLALIPTWSERERDQESLVALTDRFGLEPPAADANHFRADCGAFRLRWERHTEFIRYTFLIEGGDEASPFRPAAIEAVPEDWLAALAGQVLVAHHAAVLAGGRDPVDYEAISQRHFAGNALIGAAIAGGKGRAFTDFRIHGDRFGRILVHDLGMTARQAGRTVQRLLEIDTYRMLALMAFPVARGLAPFLNHCERELVEIAQRMTEAREEDEPVLLDRLSRLAAAIERRHAETHYRFSAAAAYHELVQRRIAELRETRIEGLQTFGEFTGRRLAPAMSTCRAVAHRQESVSERGTRVTQLLSIRVDLTRERQNHEVLASMNRRARLQLRLQQTVEGLSIAAVTYYVVGLVGYVARGLKGAGMAVDTAMVTAASVPVVALLVALGVRRVRRLVQTE